MPGTAFPFADENPFGAIYDFDSDLDGELGFLAALLSGLTADFSDRPNNPQGDRVFDWKRAAERIVETGATTAEAGLTEDWGMTGGPILADGEIVPEDETYTFLQSRWATPVLRLDGVEEECWTLAAESDYSHVSYWPADAREILGA